jgi:hypothetical protein
MGFSDFSHKRLFLKGTRGKIDFSPTLFPEGGESISYAS